MSPITALAVYFIMWWVVLFAVLPWGVRSQQESGEVSPGTDPGAPALPRLKQKLVWTTIVTTVVFAAWYAAYINQLIPIDRFARWIGIVP